MKRSTSGVLTEDQRAFLQHRVAVFGLVTAGIFGFGVVFRMVINFVDAGVEAWLDPNMTFHALATAMFLLVWLLCRSGSRSVTFIRRVEFGGLVGGGWALVAMGIDIGVEANPELIQTIVLTYLLVARSIYVPSSARRTLVFGVALGAPLLTATYWIYLNVDPVLLGHALQNDWGPEATAPFLTMTTAVYWGTSVILCTGASKVIYGLRKAVRDVRRLGQYNLEKKLGEGGMGIVYRASHAMLRRATAIKLLLPDRAGEQAVVRFEREVQLTARLTHPNTVTIFDYGRTPDGVFYYAMELLDGATLQDVVEVTGAQPAARVCKVLSEAAGALMEAHAIGLIHRDIKPANIMLCTQGGVRDVTKLLDFGLVKEVDQASNLTLSRADTVIGTPLYMSPEAIVNPQTVDARSDIYSLGAVGYYILTGEHVFTGGSTMEVCIQHVKNKPIPPSERLGSPVSSSLEQVLLACLAKDPEDRPSSAQQLRDELSACDDIGSWDAAWWWEEYGPALSRRAEVESSDANLTVDIDLARRRNQIEH